jgi:hypothetical protein
MTVGNETPHSNGVVSSSMEGAGRSGLVLVPRREDGFDADHDPDQVERYRRPSGANPAAVRKQSPANHVDGIETRRLAGKFAARNQHVGE